MQMGSRARLVRAVDSRVPRTRLNRELCGARQMLVGDDLPHSHTCEDTSLSHTHTQFTNSTTTHFSPYPSHRKHGTTTGTQACACALLQIQHDSEHTKPRVELELMAVFTDNNARLRVKRWGKWSCDARERWIVITSLAQHLLYEDFAKESVSIYLISYYKNTIWFIHICVHNVCFYMIKSFGRNCTHTHDVRTNKAKYIPTLSEGTRVSFIWQEGNIR